MRRGQLPARNEGGFFQRSDSMHKKAKNTGERRGSMRFFRSKEMDLCDASKLNMEKANDAEQVLLEGSIVYCNLLTIVS
jgi:hypothetical protein